MYLACSSESSVRWASKFGRCRLATYSSAGKHACHKDPGTCHWVAVLSNSRTAATCMKLYSLTDRFNANLLFVRHYSPIFLGRRYTSCLYRPSGALNNSIRARAWRHKCVDGRERPQRRGLQKWSSKCTNLSCSSDGQHKCRHSGAAQIKEATLREEKRPTGLKRSSSGAAVTHNKEEEQHSRQLPADTRRWLRQLQAVKNDFRLWWLIICQDFVFLATRLKQQVRRRLTTRICS